MIHLRKSTDRGHANHGWLDTWNTFSYSTYFDPKYTKFGSLRVLNEDTIQPGTGFALQPHQNMEMITYVDRGDLAYKDNMGHSELIHAGELQRISAGTGILHSEFNPSPSDPCHIYQIWISPDENFIEPSYEKMAIQPRPSESLTLLASKTGREKSLCLHQDADLFLGSLKAGEELQHSMPLNRSIWLQIIAGTLAIGPITLQAGDGLGITHERHLEISALVDADFLLFDMA
jgi:quercetin 2,3-dioxygenase